MESLRAAQGPTARIRYPRMPDEADPHYAPWKAALAQEFAVLGDRAVLVGHSIGGTLLLMPWPNSSRPSDSGRSFAGGSVRGRGGMAERRASRGAGLGNRLPRDVPILLYQGLADDTVPPAHVDRYAALIPWAQVHRLPGRGHQFDDVLSEPSATIRGLLEPG